VVLGAATILGDPFEIVELCRFDLGVIVVELFVGKKPSFDSLGKLDLLLGVQQRDLADLLQVILHRVSRGTGCHHLLLGFVGVVGLRQGEALILGQLFFKLRLFSRLEGGLVYVIQAALLADREHDLFALQVDHDIRRERFSV
jgi:hypothetical protein